MFTNLKLNGSLTPNLGPILFPNLMHNYKTKLGPVENHFIWLNVENLKRGASANCKGLGRGVDCGVGSAVDSGLPLNSRALKFGVGRPQHSALWSLDSG